VKLEKQTPFTNDDQNNLIAELKNIRYNDYALDCQENNVGISCIAAPVRDYSGKVIAAVSATGPSFKIDNNKEYIKGKVTETAREVSMRMGY